MSLSSQLGTFLIVALIYIVFTFAWAWYKGKQKSTHDKRSDETATGGER